jgi:glycosyltransferase involved in cell wall biosynthesis
MRKINVLFMQSQSFFGSDSMIHSLIMRHLNRSRVTVHVACNAGSPGEASPALQALEKIPDLRIRPTDFGPSINQRSRTQMARDAVTGALPTLASLGGLAGYVRRNSIDIIHGTEKPRDAFYGFLLARMTGARAVTHLHVKVENWISPLVRWAMKHDDALIAVSDFVAKSAVNMGYAAERTHFVLNSLDATKWDPATDGSAVRREFGIAPETPVMAIISRVFPWKGHTLLLEAAAKARAEHDDFKLLIVGEEDPRAGGVGFMDQIKARSGQLDLSRHVIFTGFRSDVAQLLAASDLFVMPTFEEPCAVAFLEAMAMQKPVIALASGGTTQLVDQGEAGLLSAPGDADALAANIVALLRDPERRKRMGAYARKRVEEYFNPPRMANEVEEIYRRILDTPARP